jgi:hypothetical protein
LLIHIPAVDDAADQIERNRFGNIIIVRVVHYFPTIMQFIY